MVSVFDNKWGLSGNYTRDSTLTSELQTTGIVQSRERRVKWNIDPNWTRELTEGTNFDLKLSQSAVSYAGSTNSALVDYDVISIYAIISSNWTQTTTINTTLYGNRLQAESEGNESDTLGLSFGINYEPEET